MELLFSERWDVAESLVLPRIRHRDGFAVSGGPTGDSFADRKAVASDHFGVEAVGRAEDESVAVFEEVDICGIDVGHFAHHGDGLVEDVTEIKA